MTTPKIDEVSQTAAESIRKKNRKYRRDYVERKSGREQFDLECEEARKHEEEARQLWESLVDVSEKVDTSIRLIPDKLISYEWNCKQQKAFSVLHPLEVGDKLVRLFEAIVGFIDPNTPVVERRFQNERKLIAVPFQTGDSVWKPGVLHHSFEVMQEKKPEDLVKPATPNVGRVCFRYGQIPIPLMVYFEKGDQLWVKNHKGEHSVVSLNDVRFVENEIHAEQAKSTPSLIDSALDSLHHN